MYAFRHVNFLMQVTIIIKILYSFLQKCSYINPKYINAIVKSSCKRCREKSQEELTLQIYIETHCTTVFSSSFLHQFLKKISANVCSSIRNVKKRGTIKYDFY